MFRPVIQERYNDQCKDSSRGAEKFLPSFVVSPFYRASVEWKARKSEVKGMVGVLAVFLKNNLSSDNDQETV